MRHVVYVLLLAMCVVLLACSASVHATETAESSQQSANTETSTISTQASGTAPEEESTKGDTKSDTTTTTPVNEGLKAEAERINETGHTDSTWSTVERNNANAGAAGGSGQHGTSQEQVSAHSTETAPAAKESISSQPRNIRPDEQLSSETKQESSKHSNSNAIGAVSPTAVGQDGGKELPPDLETIRTATHSITDDAIPLPAKIQKHNIPAKAGNANPDAPKTPTGYAKTPSNVNKEVDIPNYKEAPSLTVHENTVTSSQEVTTTNVATTNTNTQTEVPTSTTSRVDIPITRDMAKGTTSSADRKGTSTAPTPHLPTVSTALPLHNSVEKTDFSLCSSSLFALAALATLAVVAAAPAH